jgi:hypothetical protein
VRTARLFPSLNRKVLGVRVVKRIAVRNKIDLSDPAHVRAWTRRLKLSRRELQLIIDKVGDSASAIMKEIVLQRAAAEHDAAQRMEPANE